MLKPKIENYLNMYWLRPATAVWRIHDSILLDKIEFKKPILDLGCGDGTFSFTHFGEQTSVGFDIFKETETFLFQKGRDIYNHETVTMPKIVRKPRIKIDVGLDWKKGLLSRAAKLGIYDKLIQHDMNKPLRFEAKSFETIFSNTFYWIKNIEQLLAESKRILKDNGKLIIFVPDIKFKQNLIYNEYLKHGYKYAKILDRGIYNNVKHAKTLSQWKSLFKKAGLKVEKHVSYLSQDFVRFHNIGTRPYSPYLIELSNTSKSRDKIKSRLIKETSPTMQSYLSKPQSDGYFHLFVLSK